MVHRLLNGETLWRALATLPNILSAVRLLLAVPVFTAIRASDNLTVITILGICLLTDGADGFLARRLHSTSELGRVLDPLADKAVAASVALALWLWRGLPFWFLAAVIVRDLLILFGGDAIRRRTGRVPGASILGKLTINVVVIVFLIRLFHWEEYYTVSLLVGAAFLGVSLFAYARDWWCTVRGNPLTASASPCDTELPRT